MTQILTDAEYQQLPDIGKAQYWANRYQDLKDQYDHLREDRAYLRQLLAEIEAIAVRYKP